MTKLERLYYTRALYTVHVLGLCDDLCDRRSQPDLTDVENAFTVTLSQSSRKYYNILLCEITTQM